MVGKDARGEGGGRTKDVGNKEPLIGGTIDGAGAVNVNEGAGKGGGIYSVSYDITGLLGEATRERLETR